ncbi:MAG: hypothetical protein ACYTG0_41740 [Planctomycetota bacterium]|jgi:hypothetical protein
MKAFLRTLVAVIFGFAGMLVSMVIPIMVFGCLATMIWGPEVLTAPAKQNPSAVVFPVVPPLMVASAYVYVAGVFLPLLAKHNIVLDQHPFVWMARRARRRALRVADLLARYESLPSDRCWRR